MWDLWDVDTNYWFTTEILKEVLNTNPTDILLVQQRVSLWELGDIWKMNVQGCVLTARGSVGKKANT